WQRRPTPRPIASACARMADDPVVFRPRRNDPGPRLKQRASIGRAAVRAASWLILGRIAIRLIGLLSTVVLARLLVPADFGLVAMAAVVAKGLEAVTEFSFGLVLITDREFSRERYDTAWTLNVLRGLA